MTSWRVSHSRYGLQKARGVVLNPVETMVVFKLRVVAVNKCSATGEFLREVVAEPHLPGLLFASPGSIRMSIVFGDSDYSRFARCQLLCFLAACAEGGRG